MLSRLDDKRTGAIVIVMQRVHMDDLTGFVTGQSDEWTVLNLPAIAEADEDIPISATEVYHRKAGEALSPVREPLSVLENLKRQLGSDAFSAQYQQMPVPPGGAMIKRDWIQRYDQLPPQARAAHHSPELGHRQQRRSRERLFGLHDLGRDPRHQAMVSDRRLAEAGRLPRVEGGRA